MGCIAAGVFGGASIALFLWLWTKRKSRITACAGLAGAIAMVITSGAGTSWMALGGGVVGLELLAFAQANAARSVGIRAHSGGAAPGDARSGLVPHRTRGFDWVLFERAPRYYLVDACIRHFSDHIMKPET